MRLFLAVWPPPEVLDTVAALRRPAVDGARWTGPDQWHVTMRFFGELEAVEPVLAALDGVAMAPTTAVLGPATSLLVPRIVAVPVAGLDDVAGAAIAATAAIGEPPQSRPFRGHITLARLRDVRRSAARRLVGEPVTAEWPVAELHVVRSHLSPKGATYETVASIPLL